MDSILAAEKRRSIEWVQAASGAAEEAEKQLRRDTGELLRKINK